MKHSSTTTTADQFFPCGVEYSRPSGPPVTGAAPSLTCGAKPKRKASAPSGTLRRPRKIRPARFQRLYGSRVRERGRKEWRAKRRTAAAHPAQVKKIPYPYPFTWADSSYLPISLPSPLSLSLRKTAADGRSTTQCRRCRRRCVSEVSPLLPLSVPSHAFSL